MSVKFSASLAATQLLDAVGSVATTATSAFTSLGHMADAMNAHSQEYLRRTRIDITVNGVDYETKAIRNTAATMARETKKINEEMSRDPALETLYKAALRELQTKLAPATP